MGLADDIVTVRRNLSHIALAHQRRPPSDSRDDLLERTAKEEKEARRLRQPALIASTLLQRAELLLAAGRGGEAIPVLEQVAPALQGSRQDDLRVRALAHLAEAHACLHNWQKVSALCDEGISLVEKYRYNLTSDYLASAYLRSRIPLYSWGVRSAYELGRYELMIERAELSKCRLILNQHTASARTRIGPTDDRTAEFRALSRRIAEYPAGEAPEELLTKRRMLWDLISLQESQIPPQPFSLPAVCALLRSNEAILFYYWLDTHTLAIATIDRYGFAAELRYLSSDQRQSLETYAHHALESTKPNYSAFEPVRDFGSFLLPATSPVAWQEKQRLLVSPHRVLHSIPFHALQYGDRWLIERAAVSYIANLSTLLLSPQPLKKQRVLVVGVEHFAVPGRTLPPLPEAELEACEVQRNYAMHRVPTAMLLGKEATVDRIHACESDGTLEQYSCLHFATHGENVNSDNPMESHFYMQNSLLDGLELANLRLHADTIVLSACSSGQRPIAGRGMPELPGDDLFGLQAAFFRAGAHRILATLWPVDSSAARKITAGFHARLAADTLRDAEMALQGSVCDYLTQAGIQARKIYFWAPFFLSVLGRAKNN
jgi:CHAT domain-containing protein